MQVTIPKNAIINITDDMEIVIPNYMSTLSVDNIKHVLSLPELIRCERIVACGSIDDEFLDIITGTGHILSFDFKYRQVPAGPAIPYEDGKLVFFPNTRGVRWQSNALGYNITSKWIIECSESALDDISCSVEHNYSNENIVSEDSQDNQRRD